MVFFQKHVSRYRNLSLRHAVNRMKLCIPVLMVIFLLAICVRAQDIQNSQKKILSINKKEASVISELENLSISLDNARRKSALIKKDILQLRQQIKQNSNRSLALSKQIRRNEKHAYQRIVALYKLNQIGKLNILASTDSLYAFFQRKRALETILHQDEQILEALQKNQSELFQLRQNLHDQKEKKDALETRLSVQIVNMTRKREKRARLLNEIRNKKSLTLAALESMKQSAQALDTTISGFKKEDPGHHPYAGTSPHTFSELKGLLIMPVKGKIVEFFGPYTNARFKIVNFRSGINIQAERGEPIYAVYKGTTLYASWFKGYGNMIIIDHGNHYYTLYAHAEELFKKKGDPVEAGEVIATVGDTGSMANPGLHFEVRHHGQPIDPTPWINQG